MLAVEAPISQNRFRSAAALANCSGRGSACSAALRISASARLASETWSLELDTAHDNLQRELGHVGAIVSKIEWLLAHLDGLNVMEIPHAS